MSDSLATLKHPFSLLLRSTNEHLEAGALTVRKLTMCETRFKVYDR